MFGLRLPKNKVLKAVVILFAIPFIFYFLPFIIGGFLIYFVFRKINHQVIKRSIIAGILLPTLFVGSAWAVGMTEGITNPTPSTDIPTPTITYSPTPTDSPTPTVSPTPDETPTPTITKTPTKVPTRIPTRVPTKKIIYPTATPIPTKASTAVPTYGSSGLSNDDTYINSRGVEVRSPAYSDSVPPGASAICRDGTYSFSQSRRGTCSHHGGVAQWL